MIYFIIVLAIMARFIPHIPNAAPVTALAIFGAVYLPKKQAIVIPLAVRFISDIFLGFFSWPLMAAVYASHLAGVLFGLWIRGTSSGSRSLPPLSQELTEPKRGTGGVQSRWIKIIASSLGASIIFFLVTNFAFLYSTYDHTWSGIIAAYTNGLPFFRGTLIGDLGYTVALFGGYAVVQYLARRFSVSKKLQLNT